jgi:hypothetical protein
MREKRGLRFALHVVLLVCLLTTWPGVVACRSGIRVRSWGEAISFAQEELDGAGDLEGRLEAYARIAGPLAESIRIVDQARPALDLITGLRQVEVPLIGNGWQVLLALLSVATIDGAQVVRQLEEVLRGLAELRSSLNGLGDLPGLAEEISNFRTDPSRQTLEALSSASAGATPALVRVQADLGRVATPLEDVAGNLSGLLEGLRFAAEAGIPAISGVARTGAERIGLIEEPLLALSGRVGELYQSVEADARTLAHIQEAVRQVADRE